MTYTERIEAVQSDPQQLETLYQAAREVGESAAFADAIRAHFAAAPENLLFAAWHYRLARPAPEEAPEEAAAPDRAVERHWRTAIPLSLLCGLLFWFLSDVDRLQLLDYIPALVVIWAPISACCVLAYLALAGRRFTRELIPIAGLLLLVAAYPLWTAPLMGNPDLARHYADLMALHLPLMAWAGVGLYILWGMADAENRFAFLIKSLEVLITGGLFAMAGGVFVGITVGMFEALNINLPESVMRILVAGGGGLIPVLAVATVYNPEAGPVAQSFRAGLSVLIITLMRLLLPLTLLVGVIYVAFIPFNFTQPFHNRDVLMVYNAMLFAVMALLVGVTPVRAGASGLSARQSSLVRTGILAVAGLALLVSLYALAAILYRTAQGGFTPNRLTVIGWNLVNMGVLVHLLVLQWRAAPAHWISRLHTSFGLGMNAYAVWGLLLVLLLPWLF